MPTQPDLLSERSLSLFKSLVEHFIIHGQPVGSRTLSKDVDVGLSPATIRNVMADLEEIGLLHSPHTSAGRVPTVKGYRLFIDSLLHVDKIDKNYVDMISNEISVEGDIPSIMNKTSELLSEVTKLAGVVMLPRTEDPSLEHIEFVALSANRILVVLIASDQVVQNRIIDTARTYSPSELQQASNMLNEMFAGKKIREVQNELVAEMQSIKDSVNQLMQTAIEVAQKAFNQDESNNLLLSGQTNLMDIAELGDLDKFKQLFQTFNQKRDVLHLLEQSINADGVQIFIGEESGYEVFNNCSVVTAPYESEGQILGVLGVIGPTRMKYDQVIPIVDITAKMLGSVLNSKH